MTTKELASKVRRIRLENGINRQTVLNATGVGITQLAMLEMGNNATMQTYLKLIAFYGYELQLIEKPKTGIFAPCEIESPFKPFEQDAD